MTIFSHFLHMHENGRQLITRQYRNDSSGNEVLIYSADVEYYSFVQAGAHVVYTDGTATIQVKMIEIFLGHWWQTHDRAATYASRRFVLVSANEDASANLLCGSPPNFLFSADVVSRPGRTASHTSTSIFHHGPRTSSCHIINFELAL